MATLVQMVSAGMGVTLLPEMAIPFENRDGALTVREFASPQPYREIGLAWRRNTERLADYRALGEVVKKLNP